MNIKKRKHERSFLSGFTLIEMMVAVTIFVILITAFTGFFIRVIQMQKRVSDSQEMIGNISYNLEYMSRAIRMARKDMEGLCLTTAGKNNNYETNEERSRIRFLNYENRCQEFFLENGRLKENRSTDNSSDNFQPPLPLTQVGLDVISFQLGPSVSWGQDDLLQPSITFLLEAVSKGQIHDPQLRIKVQTTVSQRNLNVQY